MGRTADIAKMLGKTALTNPTKIKILDSAQLIKFIDDKIAQV